MSALFCALLLAQPGHSGHAPPADIQASWSLNAVEVVTGIAASLMALQAALAYRERRLGAGMTWATVGMVVMAIGHLILVIRRLASFDPLGFLGKTGSFVAFSIAVFISFVTSAYGFWLIRREAPRYARLEASEAARRTGSRTTQSPP